MKILYISNSIIPSKTANTVHVLNMCKAFSQDGHYVTLVYKKNGSSDSFDNFEYKINPLGINISKKWYILKLQSLVYAIKAKKWIKKHIDEYDIVYGRFTLLLYLLRKKHKFAYESHVFPYSLFHKYVETKIMKSENCVKFVVISNSLKTAYCDSFGKNYNYKISVLHDGAPEAEIVKEKEFRIKKNKVDDIVVGYLGHLYPGKCMEVLTSVALVTPGIKYHVVGGTEYWVNYWKSFLTEKGISNVFLYGYVNNSEVKYYYSSFDIIILPFSKNVLISKNKKSDIGKWFSPLKLFESMSYGKAIIVSNLETIMEVMDDNVDCMMCNPDNPNEWRNALNELLADKERRALLGENAKKKFLEKYTWKERIRQIVRWFNNEN